MSRFRMGLFHKVYYVGIGGRVLMVNADEVDVGASEQAFATDLARWLAT